MTLAEEIEALRRQLEMLASASEPLLTARYALRFPPPEQLSLYRRVRLAVGRTLRDLGLRRSRPVEPWLPGLRHQHGSDERPFIIWAIGADRDVLREACRGFASLENALSGRVPVLVTDVADFAYFSRLGWLVEYVPTLSPPAEHYATRKARYLAWRYRDAPALPISAGLREGVRPEELLLG